MRSSANLCAYSDMPSFLSQSAICCMAVTPSGPDRVFHHGNREFTPISLRYHAWRLNRRANARRVAPLATLGLLEGEAGRRRGSNLTPALTPQPDGGRTVEAI